MGCFRFGNVIRIFYFLECVNKRIDNLEYTSSEFECIILTEWENTVFHFPYRIHQDFDNISRLPEEYIQRCVENRIRHKLIILNLSQLPKRFSIANINNIDFSVLWRTTLSCNEFNVDNKSRNFVVSITLELSLI